jgi:hypothetical protein
VAAERWNVFGDSEWKAELTASRVIVASRLPKRTRDVLAMPLREQKRLIARRRTELKTGPDQKS